MMYHVPSLKKLIKEPKKWGTRLITTVDDDEVWFSDGHWALKVQPHGLPIALTGFLPTSEETTGYKWQPGEAREAGGPDIHAVIPKDTKPATLTPWLHSDAETGITRMVVTAKGTPVFFDTKFLDPLLAVFGEHRVQVACGGDANILVGSMSDGVGDEVVLVLMPIRVDGVQFVDDMARKYKTED